jgi:catechol-2,3-dioxygenase
MTSNNMEIGSIVIRIRDIEKVSAFYERIGLQLDKKISR